MYDGLLLDHDGVLVNLCDIDRLREAARRAFVDAGVNPSPDDVETLSISVDRGALLALGDRYDVDSEQLWQYRDERVAQILRDATRSGEKDPYDDTAALTDTARPLGVVSNNQTRVVEFVLDYHGIDDWFGTVHARSPVPSSLEHKKPEPTYLEEAMSDLDIENPLYVGDKATDIVAGQRAGLDTVLLRREHNADNTLDVTPDYDVGGLDEVVEILNRESTTTQ